MARAVCVCVCVEVIDRGETDDDSSSSRLRVWGWRCVGLAVCTSENGDRKERERGKREAQWSGSKIYAFQCAG